MLAPEDLRVLAEAFLYPRSENLRDLAAYLEVLSREHGFDPGEAFQVKDLEALQAEYTRLFITSPQGTPAPPYASVYLSPDRQLKGPGYDQALAFYQEAGYAPVEEGELADHVAYELAFMALLLENKRTDLLRRFLKEHFRVWYPAFQEALLGAQPLPFYAQLAQLTDRITQTLSEKPSPSFTV